MPEVTFRFVLIVKIDVPVPARADGVKLALACLGRPVTLKDTVPVKLPALPIVTV